MRSGSATALSQRPIAPVRKWGLQDRVRNTCVDKATKSDGKLRKYCIRTTVEKSWVGKVS